MCSPVTRSVPAFVSTVLFADNSATAASCLCQPQRLPAALTLACFPSHESLLPARGLCSGAGRAWGREPLLATAASGCLGRQTFLRSKSGGEGRGISNHCLKLLLQPSPACGISPHPPTAPGADRPSLSYAYTPEHSPKYTRALTKSHLSRCCRGGKSACGLRALLPRGKGHGRGLETGAAGRKGCQRLQACLSSAHPPAPEGLFLPETLLARECKEEPRWVTLLVI